MSGKKVLLAMSVVAFVIGCGSSSKIDEENAQADAVQTNAAVYKRTLAKDESYPAYYTTLEKVVMKDVMTRYFDVNAKGIMSYGLEDASRAAGHVCPAVTGSFLMTREALKYLANEYKNNPTNEVVSYDYEDGLMYRGGVKITMSGKDNTGGANNAMANVMSYITGAKGADGFKGGPDFPFANKQNLLTFDSNLSFSPSNGIEAIFTSMKATYVKVDDNGTETPATFKECEGTWGDCKEITTCDKSVKVTYKFIGGDQKYERRNLRMKYIVDHYNDAISLEAVENPTTLCAN